MRKSSRNLVDFYDWYFIRNIVTTKYLILGVCRTYPENRFFMGKKMIRNHLMERDAHLIAAVDAPSLIDKVVLEHP